MTETFFAALTEHFDLPILDWIASHFRCTFLDKVMPVVTGLGDSGLIWILLAVVALLIPRHRGTGIRIAVALVIGLIICNLLMKPLFARIRPFDYCLQHLGKLITLLIPAPTDFSFPSGHTIASFEAATVLCLRSRKAGIAAMILAALIAFSRLYLYVHYPTDVLFSSAAGIGIGFFSDFIVTKLERIKKEHA